MVSAPAPRSHLSPALLDTACVIGLALLPWLYFWRLFAPNRADQMTVSEGDFTGGQFPLLLTVARALHDGVAPLWNPLSGGGQPLLAHPQAGALYPLDLLVLPFMQGWDAGSLLALERTIPLHVGLASIFTFALVRVLTGSRPAALVAAICYGYSGFLTSYPIPQLPILRSASWFPLQLLAWWLALERRSAGWAAVTGLTVALAFLAGHPQTVFEEVLGLALITASWSYLMLFRRSPSSKVPIREVVHVIPLGMLAVAIAVGTTAVQWVPTAELQGLSSRADEGYNFVASGFSFWEVPMDLLAPNVLGGFPPYVGVITLILVAAGLALTRGPLHGIFLPLPIAGLLLAFGGQTFLYPALYVVIPGFDLFRNQERTIMLFSMGGAVLAGVGARAVLEQRGLAATVRMSRFTRALGSLLLLSIALGAALYVGHISAEVAGQRFQRWRDVISAYFFFVFVLALSWGIFMARLRVPSIRPALATLIIGLVAFDLFTVTADRQFTVRPADSAYHQPQVVDRLLSDIGFGKAADRDILSGNHGLLYGIPSVNSTFPLRIARLDTARVRLPEARFFDLLNVTHVIAQKNDSILQQPGAPESLTDAGYVLFRRSSSPGPAYIVAQAQHVATAEEALQRIGQPDFDPRRQVLVESPAEASLPIGGPGTVTQFGKAWGQTNLRVTAPSGGYLVVSDVAYPGWHATVDGADQAIWRADYLIQAIQIPPGEHTVDLRYEPDSVRLGLILSLITLTLLGFWAILWAVGLVSGRFLAPRRFPLSRKSLSRKSNERRPAG